MRVRAAHKMRAVVLTVVVGTSTLAACSSSDPSNSGVSGKEVKIGMITDSTGQASSGFSTNKNGIKAYLKAVNATGGVNGKKITYVNADTNSTPAGALLAAKKLVEVDKVFAVVENSSVFFGAAPYLLKEGVPVVGSAIDGPEWADAKYTNLFAAGGIVNAEYLNEFHGEYMKARGVTVCGSLGIGGSKSSQRSAIGFTKSCELAGLKAGYTNTQLPIGSTDVGAIALEIKESGVDGLFLPVVPSTAFAIVGALKSLGVNLKSILVSTGYGGDLLKSQSAVKVAQGVDFATIGNPAEANTAATKKRARDLAAVGSEGPPTFAEQYSYLVTSAFVTGLEAAGARPTRENFMKAMSGIKDFDADGLLAPKKVNFRDYAPAQSCLFVARLVGSKFEVPSETPLCAQTKKF